MAILLAGGAPLTAAETNHGLIYHPEGDAIVIEHGTRWNNRPLYEHERFSFITSGEMPGFQGDVGRFRIAIERHGQRLLLHQFQRRIMRYRPGRLAWECTDPQFPDLTISLALTTLADGNGATAQVSSRGAHADDRVLWLCFPPSATPPRSWSRTISRHGYTLTPTAAESLGAVEGRLAPDAPTWETLAESDGDDPDKGQPLTPGTITTAGLIAGVPLRDAITPTLAVIADDNDPTGWGKLVRRQQPLDPACVADPLTAFADGMARVHDFDRRLIIETPDPYLNAGAPMAVAAAAGLFVHPTFVHGGSQWRQQQPGWRTMGGAIAFGWRDHIQRAVEFWGSHQVTSDDGQHHAPEYSANGCQQAGNSLFFGKGFIDYQQPPNHYDFQTQFFDEAIRAWRASADPRLEQRLRPMLDLHLEHCRVCFDPDGDGLYESYNNTWPNDSIWFNGGGTPEQSAYVHYGHLAAADMARRAGDTAAAQRHTDMANRIQHAIQQHLWMPKEGHFASYLEPWGERRQMPDAWIYGQHIPIECGITTPEQAWQAMAYTATAMERFPLPYGGEMRQTSNFVPGQWSVRELYHGDNFGMALGYFLAGQADEGYALLRGTMCESMYGDGTSKTGYSNSKGHTQLVNRIAPGGLSHPSCAIDFADIVSPFCRAVVEGLFGYRPDYPNGVVTVAPTFPPAWKQARIATPDFRLTFRDHTYSVTLTTAARLHLRVPVHDQHIARVTVDGQTVPYRIEPWAGYGMLHVNLPATNAATLAIIASDPREPQPIATRHDHDGPEGTHLETRLVTGEIPYYQLTQVHVDATPDARVMSQAPAHANWHSIPFNDVMNGDIQTIFSQRYDAPRPSRVSMRIGYDGWSAWTFAHWGITTPTISLAPTSATTLITPQGAIFEQPQPGRNIAFTSRWERWPTSVTVPIHRHGDAVWLLVSGSTTPMQGHIANAVLRFRYADDVTEAMPLIPPNNFWSLCGFGRADYDYARDGFSLPPTPPPQVQLGTHCRAMVYGWKLRPGKELRDITLETLSLDVVIGLMGISIMNPR